MADVDVCLATLNGARWLPEFLSSLDEQEFRDWRLIVSDDGSSDETLEILRSHFESRPWQVQFVARQRTGLGIVANFQDVLKASTADYVFLADQDDVWLPRNLGGLLAVIRVEEKGTDGMALPVLAYSDMQVINEEGTLLCESWWRYRRTDPSWAHDLRRSLTQNSVPGCSMAVNRRLLELALPIPEQAPMHDWWLLLVALVSGRLTWVPQPGVRYRRHAGAATYRRRDWTGWLNRIRFQPRRVRAMFAATVEQARCLLGRPTLVLPPEPRRVMEQYVLSARAGWWRRRWLLLRLRIRRIDLISTINFYLWV